MARVWQMLVRADGDTKAAQRELSALQKSTRQFGKNMSNLGKSLTLAVTAPILAFAALGVSELRETMDVTKKTDAVFKSMGSTMKVTKGQLSRLVTDLEKYSAIEGDIIQNAANVGLSFKALAGNPKLFDATTRAAVDMSAALGQDLQTTMTQLGKAMQNGAKGAGALSKNGTLAKDDIAKLQAMAKAGVPLWKQQAFILAAVNKQYAGQGKNVDPIKAITIAIKNMAETLAVLLLPAITKVSEWLQTASTWVSSLSKEKQKWLGVALLVAAALGPLLVVVGSLITAFAAIIPVLAGVTLAGAAVAAGIVLLVAGLVTAYTTSETFRDIVNEAFEAVKTGVIGVLNGLRSTLSTWIGWAQAAWSNWGTQITTLATAAWTFVRTFIGGQLTIIRGTFTTVLALLRGDWSGAWEGIKLILSGAWAIIRTTVSTGADAIKLVLSTAWGLVKTVAVKAWDGISDGIVAVVRALPGAIAGALGSLDDKMKSIGSAAGSALANALKGAVNAVVGAWNGFSIPAVSVLGKEVTPAVNFPDLPYLARGGITKGPSIAGEAGPEAVIPLGASARAASDRARVMREAGLTSNGMQVVQHIHTNGDVEATARRVMFELLGSRRTLIGGMT